jgi:hypothetical protein
MELTMSEREVGRLRVLEQMRGAMPWRRRGVNAAAVA